MTSIRRSNERGHRGYRQSTDIALADAGSCSGGSCNHVRNSPAVFTKSATGRDAFLHAAVLGDPRRLNRSRNRANVSGQGCAMDATHMAHFYGGNPVNWRLGHDYVRLSLASAAVLSRTRRDVTQLDQRSCAFASTAPGTRSLLLVSGYTLGVIVGLVTGVCIGWSNSVRYWGMPLLKVVGPIPATAWIPLAMVVSPFGNCLVSGINRARGVVPGHDADCVWHFQYSRVLS